jgi:hypothetical protein
LTTFTQQLHDNLEAVEDRAKSLKNIIQSLPKKTEVEIQSKLDEAKTKLEVKREEFNGYRAKIETQLKEKESEVKTQIEEWKLGREAKKLEHRAGQAEDYASTVTLLAMATLEEAEEATLAAIAARREAEAAVETTKSP